MWYAIQTFSGEEERTADMIRQQVPPDCLEECFVPKRERLKKFHGCWNKVEEVLFCGYFFAASENPVRLYEELKRVPRLTKILGREEGWFWALEEKEERFIKGIGNEGHRTPLSKVTVGAGKAIHVVDGPLKDYMGDVVKVDLHKREAVVEVEFMGRKMELKMGIEMVKDSFPGGGGI